MLTIRDYPKDYDGFYFLPIEDQTKEGLAFHFFKLKDEYSGGEPIENTSVGDKFHIAMFKRGDGGTPELDDAFEAIFADPVVYVQGLQGAEIYGCICRKTTKSDMWFEKYLTRTTKAVTIKKMINSLKSVLESK
jgi:hypothetical protein